MPEMNDPQRQLIRHAVAALAYRAGKALRGAPASFAEFQTGPNPKTPVRILAHMGDLLNWALAMSQGRKEWRDSTPLAWDAEIMKERSGYFVISERREGSLLPPRRLVFERDSSLRSEAVTLFKLRGF